MGNRNPRRVARHTYTPLLLELPLLGRKRQRAFEEWLALERWGRLRRQERQVPGFMLRKARMEANLSQQELASRLGCSQQAVSQADRWRSNPTVGFMESWARETGCELVMALSSALSKPRPSHSR